MFQVFGFSRDKAEFIRKSEYSFQDEVMTMKEPLINAPQIRSKGNTNSQEKGSAVKALRS